MIQSPATFKGRCYCGAFCFTSAAPPQIVTYCHCADCRRWTGAPAPVFAAFDATDVDLAQAGAPIQINPGVTRWNCQTCHAPLSAQFDYLPGQTYMPAGLFEDVDALQPSLHCHVDQRAAWLTDDGLPQAFGSGRAELQAGI